MKISIIIPTLGRQEKLATLLKSLGKVAQKNLEVIIVDQNRPGFLDQTLKNVTIRHLRHYAVNFRCASMARNFGLARATGELVNFCDDDATVAENLYETVRGVFLKAPELDMATFKVLDPDTLSLCMVRFSNKDEIIDKRNFNTITIEFAQFWRRESLLILGGYNHTLGPGSYYAAEEGQDLIVRAIDGGLKMRYINQSLFYHPSDRNASVGRFYSYSRGTGRLCHLHFMKPYVLTKQLSFFTKSFIGTILYIPIRPQKSFRYSARMAGFIVGLLNSIAGSHLHKH